jgi:hypothetical protein
VRRLILGTPADREQATSLRPADLTDITREPALCASSELTTAEMARAGGENFALCGAGVLFSLIHRR